MPISLTALCCFNHPKVIHLKIGNMKLADFIAFIDAVWVDISFLNQTNNWSMFLKIGLKRLIDWRFQFKDLNL